MLRGEAIVHVAAEHPVLDQDAPRRLHPLVVDVDRAARLEERRVVDDGAELARDALADLAGVVARPLPVEVRLEPVADRFVEEDAAVAGGEDDLHLPGGRVDRVEHRDRLPRRLARVERRALRVEVAHRDATAAARVAVLPLAVALGDRADAEAEHRLHVVDEPSVARRDQDLADLLREARLRLDDPRIVGVSEARGLLEERALVDAGDLERGEIEIVAMGYVAPRERERRRASPGGSDLGRRACGVEHRGELEIFDVRVAGRVAALDANAEAHRDAARGALEDPLLEAETSAGAVLEEKIGVVTAAREGFGEEALAGRGIDRGGPVRGEGSDVGAHRGGPYHRDVR